LEKSYHNPIRRIFHWWGDRNSNDEVAEIKALLGFDLQAKVDAKAYQLCRAVSTKRGVNTEMLASAYRTLPSEWREKVEQRFCAWRGIDPNGFASYVVGQAKNSEKSLVQTIIGPDGNQLAKVDASFLFASVNGWRSNLQKLSESMGEMPKNHLQRVVQELDLLLSETSFGSFAGWLDKNIQKLHRNSFFDRVYYLTQAATEDNCHGAYWKAEAARFQAALARSSKEFLAAVFLEKSPVERKLVVAAYEEIYQSVLLEEAKKRQYGLSPLAQRLLEYAVDPSKDDDRMLLKKSGIPLALMFADVYEGLGTHELGLFELLNSLTQKELTKVAADFNAELTYSIAQRASVEVFAGVSKVFYSQRWGGLPHQELESNMPNLGGRNLVRETFAELDGTHLVTAMQLLYGNDRPNRHKVRDLEQLVLIARSPKMAWYVDWYTREGKALDRDLVLLKDYFERVSTLQFLTPEQQEHFDFLEESVRTSLDSYGKSAKNTAFQSANWLAIGAVTVATYACASIGTGLLSGFLIAGTIGACMTLAARVSVSRLINGESHGRESFLWDAGLALIDGYTLKIGFLARYLGPLTRSFIGPVAVRFINSPLGRKCTASIVKGSIKFLARNRILATLASSENKESQYVNYVYQMVSEERRNQYRSQASKIAEQILLYG
ncbi:MAG: hypothetical protein KDD62_10595, partial [Bdellovibrionales bacterium]|nr:hypothetical protein [Bdellovibrionales bacterium]